MVTEKEKENKGGKSYKNSGTGYDSHQEVWNKRSYNHHAAFYNSNTSKKIQAEEHIMRKFSTEFHHVKGDSPGDDCNCDKEWK